MSGRSPVADAPDRARGHLVIGRPTATWIDAFYMTFITVATIGFGEMVDSSNHPGGRLFTVAIAVLGVSVLSFLFSTFAALPNRLGSHPLTDLAVGSPIGQRRENGMRVQIDKAG